MIKGKETLTIVQNSRGIGLFVFKFTFASKMCVFLRC